MAEVVQTAKTLLEYLRNINEEIVKGYGDWANVDANISKLGRTIGGTSKALASLRNNIIQTSFGQSISFKYDIDDSELVNSVLKYKQAIGRDVSIGFAKDLESMASIVKIYGEDKGNQLMSGLEYFGLGIQKTVPYATRLYETSVKSGLSFEKYSEGVIKNLKLASKYGFENGIQGLEKMVKSSVALNMNVENATKMADKIIGGSDGLSAAVQMGAGLQTLGGNFAQIGDPLYLLSSSINDIGGLQDAITQAVSDMAEIDEDTGELHIDPTNMLMLREAAKSMNISYDELVNGAMRKGMIEKVDKTIGDRDIDSNLKELLENKAVMHNFDGSYEAAVEVNGVLQPVKDIIEDASLQANLLAKHEREKKYKGETESEKLTDIALSLKDIKEVFDSFVKEANTKANQWFEVKSFDPKTGKYVGGGAVESKSAASSYVNIGSGPGNALYGNVVKVDSGSPLGELYRNYETNFSELRKYDLITSQAINSAILGVVAGLDVNELATATANKVSEIYGIFADNSKNLAQKAIELYQKASEDLPIAVTSLRNAIERNTQAILIMTGVNPNADKDEALTVEGVEKAIGSERSATGGILGNPAFTITHKDIGDDGFYKASKGEYVVNRRSVERYRNLINSINENESVDSILSSLYKDSGINISKLTGENVDIASNMHTPVVPSNVNTVNKTNGSMDINVKMGDFKLEVSTASGESTSINLNDLIRTPEFEHAIIDMVRCNFATQFIQGNYTTNGLG